MLLNLVKSCNYYHHRVTVSTSGIEIKKIRATSSRGVHFVFRQNIPLLINDSFAQVE